MLLQYLSADALRVVCGYFDSVDAFMLRGHDELAKYLPIPPTKYNICRLAARTGNLAVLEYARSQGCPWNQHTTAGACRSGSLECLIFAVENKCPYTDRCWRSAIAKNHRHVLEYVHNNKLIVNGSSLFEEAVQTKNIDIIEWLKNAGYLWDNTNVLRMAARTGHFTTLSYVLSFLWRIGKLQVLNNVSLDERNVVLRASANAGSLACFRYLIQRPPFADAKNVTGVCAVAARYGHIDILEHAYTCGHNLGGVCVAAVLAGRPDILRWARARGADYEGSCNVAASLGDLALLERLRADGARCEHTIRFHAAAHGWVHILMWARRNGFAPTRNEAHIAAKQGQIVVLRYLSGLGVKMDSNACRAAADSCRHELGEGDSEHCGLASLRFAVSDGVVLPPGLCDITAKKGCIDTVSFLDSIGYTYYRDQVLAIAKEHDHAQIVDWFEHRK